MWVGQASEGSLLAQHATKTGDGARLCSRALHRFCEDLQALRVLGHLMTESSATCTLATHAWGAPAAPLEPGDGVGAQRSGGTRSLCAVCAGARGTLRSLKTRTRRSTRRKLNCGELPAPDTASDTWTPRVSAWRTPGCRLRERCTLEPWHRGGVSAARHHTTGSGADLLNVPREDRDEVHEVQQVRNLAAPRACSAPGGTRRQAA